MKLLNEKTGLLWKGQHWFSMRKSCQRIFHSAVYILNRCPTKEVKNKTPSEKCIIVGYSSLTKWYRLYNFESKKIIISQDFFFFLWEGFWGLKEKKVPENAFVIEVQESIPAVQYEEASPQSLMAPSSLNSREEFKFRRRSIFARNSFKKDAKIEWNIWVM